jgi:hypothetical protein
MDTLPYWYEPLGEVFGVDGADVARRADHWITDVLGASQGDWWTDPRELGRTSYGETENDHGSIPVVEIMRKYLEYHGMQLAAGMMVDSLPVVRTRWSKNPWEDWLHDQLDTTPDAALAALRSDVPLLPPLVGRLESALYGSVPSDRYFHGFLTGDPLHEGMIAVSGFVSTSTPAEHQSVIVESALVSPTVAVSLLSALQSAHDASDFALPLDGDGREFAIRDHPFTLLPFLTRRRWERGALDRHDPDAGSLPSEYDVPSPRILRALGLQEVPGRLSFRSAAGREAATVRAWDDERDGSGSSGYQTWVARDLLAAYLRRRRMELILVVKVHGYDRGHVEKREHYEPARCRAYLLRRDGRLFGLDRDLSPR